MIDTPYCATRLEGAPVPIAGHTDRHLGLALARCAGAAVGRASRHGASGHRPAAPYGVLLPLLLLLAGGAGGVAVVATPPDLEVAVAVLTRPAGLAARVIVGALVERHLVAGVRIAEDVAAAPTVVATHEVVEEPFAGGVVATIGFIVGLFED